MALHAVSVWRSRAQICGCLPMTTPVTRTLCIAWRACVANREQRHMFRWFGPHQATMRACTHSRLACAPGDILEWSEFVVVSHLAHRTVTSDGPTPDPARHMTFQERNAGTSGILLSHTPKGHTLGRVCGGVANAWRSTAARVLALHPTRRRLSLSLSLSSWGVVLTPAGMSTDPGVVTPDGRRRRRPQL